MIKHLAPITLTLLLTVVLPLCGLAIGGDAPLSPYLEFPFIHHFLIHADFSRPAVLGASVAAALVLLIVFCFISFSRQIEHPSRERRRYPAWGLASLLFLGVVWAIAWTRLDYFRGIQEYTFTPLWLGYILVINSLTKYRTGRCTWSGNAFRFLLLFPLSALFWWLFEYLNRFVQNWNYLLPRPYSPLEYTILASVSFSTVLPAVSSTADLLASFAVNHSVRSKLNIRSSLLPLLALIGSAAGLFLLALFPNLLFPLLWLAPVTMVFSLNSLLNGSPFFTGTTQGELLHPAVWCFAALVCGLFWEMWNYFSLAKWVYTIPYFQKYQLFEMPLLGYLGYLPFGLECAVITSLLLPSLPGSRMKSCPSS